QFRNPVARAIVEERRKLTLHPKQSREDVARSLSALSAHPDGFHGDIVVFLALRTAVARLMLDRTAEAVPALQKLLWDTALRVEDGQISIAERNLRDAQQALMEALNRNAPDAELKKLMDELQQAMNAFLDAMEQQMRDAMARGEQPPQMPPDMQGRTLDRQDIQRMMDQMRQMAETGSRDAARQMLSQLQEMMENLRAGNMGQQQQDNQAGQMMQELEKLTEQQRRLLDQTFRDAQSRNPPPQDGQDDQDAMQGDRGQQQPGQMGQQGQQQGRMPGQRPGQRRQQGQRGQQQGQQGQQGQGGQQGQQGAAQQQALRRQLGDLMRRLGEMGGDIPRPLGRAERAMRDAEQALGQNAPGAAVPPQTQALDELQQGLQSLAEQMAQQMMGPNGQQGGQQPNRPGKNRDPLGRPMPGNGNMDTETVQIPEQSDLQKAREILDELRRRSGEFSRPQIERDYIDRLLRRF
ncbi:MAG TPA: DUF4175 family protein, partial [Acetobacteraceae bacterium]